jgi:hypothetical protein
VIRGSFPSVENRARWIPSQVFPVGTSFGLESLRAVTAFRRRFQILRTGFRNIMAFVFQTPLPTPWPDPIGPTPDEVFRLYFHDGVNKTWGNISPLYQLDTFDWVVLILYFTILTVLAVYGAYRV